MACSVHASIRMPYSLTVEKFDSRSSSASAQAKQELIGQVGQAVAEWQHAVQTFDEAAAHWLGINLTDLRCLGTLYRDGSATAGHLAKVAGITAGATTAAIDRLERLGYVERVRDTPDRRQVRVELTELLQERFDRIWGPLVH